MFHAVMPRSSAVSPPTFGLPLSGDDAPNTQAQVAEAAALRTVIRAAIACILGKPLHHPDVEDCTHETLTRAMEGKDRVQDGQPMRPWVLGIARHVATDALRRDRRTRMQEPLGKESDPTAAALDAVEDPNPGPEEQAVQAERTRKLEVALQKLGDPQRRALLAFHVDGLSYQQIAQQLDIPLGTVATWISRGRRSLAEALGES